MRGGELRDDRAGPRYVQYGYSQKEILVDGLRAHLEGHIYSKLVDPTSVIYRRRPVRRTVDYSVLGVTWPVPDMDSEANQVLGMKQRVFVRHPLPDPELAAEFVAFAERDIKERFAQLPADHDMSVETWLMKGKKKWPGYKYRTYVEAYEQYTDWFEMMEGKRGALMQQNCIKAFLKDESYNKYKPPRGIYARTVGFKILFGPVFSAMEDVIFHDQEFIKHVPASERAAFLAAKLEGGHTFLVTDYSRFESQFRPWLMQATTGFAIEHILEHLPHAEPFLRMFKEVLTGVNVIEFTSVLALLAGRRMSGEMDTSLSNGLANSTIMRFAAHKHNATFKAVFEGDDGLLSWFGKQVPTVAWFERLGLCIKLDVVESWAEASFCGVVVDVDSLVVTTDPVAAIADFGWLSSKKYGAFGVNKCRILYRARALSMLHQYPGCPVLQAFAKMVLRETRDIGDHGVRALLRKGWGVSQYMLDQYRDAVEHFAEDPDFGVRPVDMATRLVMEKAFKLDVQEQIALEVMFNNHVRGRPLDLAAFTDHPTTVLAQLNDVLYVCPDLGLGPCENSDWLERLRTGRRYVGKT